MTGTFKPNMEYRFKRPALPTVLYFEDLGPCYWELKRDENGATFRSPRKGEYYASGAIPQAYKAPNDLGGMFHVVRPTHKAIQVTGWRPGDKVEEV